MPSTIEMNLYFKVISRRTTSIKMKRGAKEEAREESLIDLRT